MTSPRKFLLVGLTAIAVLRQEGERQARAGARTMMTGVGAGSLMTPFLITRIGVPPALAVGTDLLFASITKASAAWPHPNFGNVNWRLVGSLVQLAGARRFAADLRATLDRLARLEGAPA